MLLEDQTNILETYHLPQSCCFQEVRTCWA